VFYEGTYRVWEGLRILAVDGSWIRLPLTETIREQFGAPQHAADREQPEYCEALASVLSDVGNRIALDARLEPVRTGERELARRHLELLGKNADLVIYDRGYMGYLLFALHYQKQIPFLCRCSQNGFKEADELFEKQCALSSKTVTLFPSKDARRQLQAWGITDAGLRQSITVRFVRIVLKSGEIEVLATSLLNANRFPDAVFADLYHERWGSETYYDIIKNRLECENFSGTSAEAVRQDFFATVFLTNLESVLSKTAEDRLEEKTGNRYAQQVNRNVSFNALKNQVLELLLSEEDAAKGCNPSSAQLRH
jgi:hypothetical protein